MPFWNFYNESSGGRMVDMDKKKKLQDYWSDSACGYSKINVEELDTAIADVWLRLIMERISGEKNLRILDVGCGPGFFSILMAKQGFFVTAVDFSDSMLSRARENALCYGVLDRISFLQMDAQKLDFADESFDLLLSRNITWTLEKPEQAYAEWLRVLKPGGKFLNFDGNWRLHLFEPERNEKIQENFREMKRNGYEILEDGHQEAILDDLPLADQRRPLWDVETLDRLGCRDIHVLTELPDGIMNDYYTAYYKYIPMFMVCAGKRQCRENRLC